MTIILYGFTLDFMKTKRFFLLLILSLNSLVFAQNVLEKIAEQKLFNVPVFPPVQNIKQVTKEYNLNLLSYNQLVVDFSCDLQFNNYKITGLKYDFNPRRETEYRIHCSKRDYNLLLTHYFNETSILLSVDYFSDENVIAHSFINSETGVLTILAISNTDDEDNVFCSVNFIYDIELTGSIN